MQGNYVIIKHGEEFSVYAHLDTTDVNEGDKVGVDDVVGTVGLTGWTIVPHLHFAVFRFTEPKPKKSYETLEVNWQ